MNWGEVFAILFFIALASIIDHPFLWLALVVAILELTYIVTRKWPS